MTTQDTEQLLSLARDRSAQGRKVLAETISGLFGNDSSGLSERERTLIFEILHQIVRDTEMSVRQIVAAQLADEPETPQDLAVFLANDEIEVAFPILTQSSVLKDSDLIEVIRHRALEHQLAISIRYNISEAVSDALVHVGDENVILNLLRNSGAKISSSTLEYLVEESMRINSFQEPILRRDELSPDLAKRMFMWVTAALRQFITKRFELDQTVVDDLLEQAALEGANLKPEDDSSERSKADRLAADLAAEGEVTPELLVGALRNSQVHLFISLFRQKSGLRQNLITRFLLEPVGEGLAIACKAMDIDADDFATIYTLCAQVRHNGAAERNEDDIRALHAEIEKEAALRVVQYWRRDVDYLAAIRELQLSSRTDG